MALNWEDIRYRGDIRDVQELYDSYRIEDYLEAFEANRHHQDEGVRENLLKHGIRLTGQLSPRIFRLHAETAAALEVAGDAEIFCLPDSDMNAFAVLDIREDRTHSLIGITAGALEHLEDAEIKFILGHEMGHFLCGHNRLNAVFSTDERNPKATVLPPFGESLFLRWRKKAEVSADRAGLLVCRDFHAAARALLKITFGLTEKNLNLEIDALVAQIDEISGSTEMIEEAFASHPLLPVRLKALELFAGSERAKRNGCDVLPGTLADDALEDGVDRLVVLSRRYPTKPLDVAMMHVLAMAGVLVLGADADVSDEEVKLLVQQLHTVFTDEPEDVIVTDREEIARRLPEACRVIVEQGDDDAKQFLLSRIAEIALADGALMDSEAEQIHEVAKMLEVPEKVTYAVIVGAAQSVGFRADAKLNRIAAQLRRSLSP
ncbi:M48 family metalloprotease [bacterium]|nr:M48 family metalloprotease [bacterium]MBU1073493.1 M48 family metalloprotease [bacterium]MBU1676387.1 M48 family metalloprotease [bacterium]